MINRRANSTLFGFDFQINAAIVLMIKNIKEMNALRLEGNYEDIELKLSNGKYILAQAKSIENGSYDFRNVRANLRKALKTLSEAENKVEAQELILITNSFNPLNDDTSKPIFSGSAYRNYNSLPPESRQIIHNTLSQLNISLDLDKFYIQVFPFETDDEEERYKYVLEKTRDFIGMLNLNVPGIEIQLLNIWQNDAFRNSSKKDAAVKLSKKDIVWPILVIITDIEKYEDDILEEIDAGDYEDIVYAYKDLINNYCEKFEWFTKILSDFAVLKSDKKGEAKIKEFIDNCWGNYKNDFSTIQMDSDLIEKLIKIIMYNVIKRRRSIDRIKKEVNL